MGRRNFARKSPTSRRRSTRDRGVRRQPSGRQVLSAVSAASVAVVPRTLARCGKIPLPIHEIAGRAQTRGRQAPGATRGPGFAAVASGHHRSLGDGEPVPSRRPSQLGAHALLLTGVSPSRSRAIGVAPDDSDGRSSCRAISPARSAPATWRIWRRRGAEAPGAPPDRICLQATRQAITRRSSWARRVAQPVRPRLPPAGRT
jgi:hypothetical protein